MPLGSTPSGIFYWRIVAACKLHVYNVISESDIACDIMNAKHLAKIKKTLLAMQRSPRGHKSLEFEGLARALGVSGIVAAKNLHMCVDNLRPSRGH
jgi:hypothetical protein